MRCCVIALCVAAAASGCGLGRLILPDEPLVLGDDTLFVLAVHTNEYAMLQYCRDGDLASCLTTGQLTREQAPQVFALPPGRYCLMHIEVYPGTGALGGVHHDIPPERAECFDAEPGVITYPGDIWITALPTQGIYWQIRARAVFDHDIEQRLFAVYPDLVGRTVATVHPVPLARPVR